jgi:membrane-associated protease RseP (regulator of RpoE activity)
MPNNRFTGIVAFILVGAGRLAAQTPPSCAGPGAAFGVTSYQCASCGMKQEPEGRTRYLFQAEPIVLEASKTSVLHAGDVIVAVNGEPIMTQAGADQFAYPKAGPSTITVRRGSARLQLTATAVGCQATVPAAPTNASEPIIIVDGVVTSGSAEWLRKTLGDIPRSDIESIDVLKGPLASGVYNTPEGRDVVVVKTKRPASPTPKPAAPAGADPGPLIIIDGVPVTGAVAVDSVSGNGRRYGFAVGCQPSCSKVRAQDGTEYYRFDGYPPVVAVVPGGLAERAGIRVGDVVTRIDGKSILSEDGALEFFRPNRQDTMRVTVSRGGQSVEHQLRSR